MNKNILIIGGDDRFDYTEKELTKKGFFVLRYTAGKGLFAKNITGFDICLLPVPFTKDGIHLFCNKNKPMPTIEQAQKALNNKICFTFDDRITGTNLMKDKFYTRENARLTAIGVLKELISFEKDDIQGKKALVTGYGFVGKEICDTLSCSKVNVSVYARRKEQREKCKENGFTPLDFSAMINSLPEYDYIFNTVPATVFNITDYEKTKKSCAFFEIANGLDKETICVIRSYTDCAGMPGKHCPKGAGRIIADFITKHYKE